MKKSNLRVSKHMSTSRKIFLPILLFSIFLFTVQPAGALSATGGTITTDGAYTIHTFTVSATSTVTGSGEVEYLIVGGGGGGGWNRGGGGGAGGFLTATTTVTAGDYTVTVGAGGAGNTSGASSSFNGITASGGGFGGDHNGTGPTSGGSGGGGGTGGGGAGTAGQGNNGGPAGGSGDSRSGGGGGGAGVAGSGGGGFYGGPGGNGLASSITGSSVTYAGGGGGTYAGGTRGAPGSGGGGTGGSDGGQPGTSGTNGKGGGGGGGALNQGGASGGSGVVILRYIAGPIVSSTTPTDNATDIALDTNLSITFDENTDVETGNITIKKTSDNSTVETIDVTSGQVTGSGTNTITVNPSVNLSADVEYYVQIDATAFDNANGDSYAGIADTTTWSFTTLSAAVTLSSATSTATEGGATGSYTIVLDSQPSATTTITMSNDNGQATSTPNPLTFTTSNWATPQTVTVTATDDDIDEDTATSTISHTVSSGDSNYDGLSVSNNVVTITDNDTAGVTLTNATSSAVEGTTNGSYTVVLDTEPTNTVTITLAGDADATTTPDTLTFTTGNWDTPQTVTTTAISDGAGEGAHTGTITHTASSTDTKYDGISISNHTVNITEDTTNPVASAVTATPSSTSATITWTTDEAASSKVSYGLTSTYTATTTETDTSPRVTSHSVALSGLTACTTYHYNVFSEDAVGNSATSTDDTFDTTGCTGSASVTRKAQSQITTSSGGTPSLTSGDANAVLIVPAGFAGSDANFQIKQLNTTSITGTTGTTYGGTRRNVVGNHTYSFSANTGVGSVTSSFDQPITVTIAYSEAETKYTKESTHRIYRWTGSAWEELSNCTVDTAANTVTCTTSSFSTFILMGEPASGGSRQYDGPGAITTPVAEKPTQTEEELIASLQAQILQLQAQINALLGVSVSQIPTTTQVSSTLPPAGLYPGDHGPEVLKLQQLLNETQFKISTSGDGSPGNETDVYGQLTQDAVQRFQLHYNLVPNENTPGYGIFGPRTRAKLGEVL